MVSDDTDNLSEHEEKVQEAADEALDTDDSTTPFSKWEIVETIKEKIRMQDSKKREQLLSGYSNTVDRREFLKLLGFTAGGAVIAGGTGWFMGKKVFSDTTPHTITGMQTGNGDYETVSSRQSIGAGDTLSNLLIQGSDIQLGAGQGFISASGSNWTIRNIGVEGEIPEQCATIIGLTESGGTSTVENIYIGDGAQQTPVECRSARGTGGHGITGSWVSPNSSGTINYQRCNIQGMYDNSIYASAPAGSATINIENCYSANSYVSSFRLASGSIRDSVAYNDGDGYNGRPVWVWSPGPVEIEDSHFDAGPYGTAIVADGTVNFNSGAYSGSLQGTSAGSGVSQSPDLSLDNIPTDAEMAASGEGEPISSDASGSGNGDENGNGIC